MTMDKLKALREQAGVTQNGLASAIGKSHTYVWSVEAGRVKLTARDTIAAWADALGVHPDEVYKAIGAVPHDIAAALANAGPATWEQVRELLQLSNE